jgi:hypothetical protein
VLEEFKSIEGSELLLGSAVLVYDVVSGLASKGTFFVGQLKEISESFRTYGGVDFEIDLHENGINEHLHFFVS